MRRTLVVLFGILFLYLVFPHQVWAWSPGTHIYLGQSVLANLDALPAMARELLRAYPVDFLYGSIGAENGMAGTSGPPSRATGASRSNMHSSAIVAEISAPAPYVRLSS